MVPIAIIMGVIYQQQHILSDLDAQDAKDMLLETLTTNENIGKMQIMFVLMIVIIAAAYAAYFFHFHQNQSTKNDLDVTEHTENKEHAQNEEQVEGQQIEGGETVYH